MSRQKLDFDEKTIAKLALDGASNRDIAALLGCDESTIRDRFPALLHKKRAERRMEIRKAQFKSMKDGNSTMLVWLGKQELNQTDKIETKNETKYSGDAKLSGVPTADLDHLERIGSGPVAPDGP